MESRMSLVRLFTGVLLTLLMVIGGLIAGVQPALAQAGTNGGTIEGNICMQRIFMGPDATLSQSNTLNCTANDIKISGVAKNADGTAKVSPSSCQDGVPFDLTATFLIDVTANSRYDAGFFFRIDGGASARGEAANSYGVCSLSWLTPGISPALVAGSTGADPDTCGDLNAGKYEVTFFIPGVACEGVTDPNDSTRKIVKLPNCTSWHSNAQTSCDVPPPASDAFFFHPDTKSKCVCDDNFTVPVIVQQATALVQKMCTTANTPGPATSDPGDPTATPPVAATQSPTSCDSGVEGSDEVTYKVVVTNQSNFGNISITSLTDSIYGNIAGTCPSGTCTADSTGCSVPQTISAGSDYTCTFTAKKTGDPADATVTNSVSASGKNANNDNIGPFTSNTVTVTPTEAPSSATVTKGLGSPNLTAGCATARFTVDVTNTSSTTYDETEILKALSDSVYGSIAPTTADTTNVSNNTCFTSTSGVTLNPGDKYSCRFDGKFCGTLSSIEDFNSGKCSSGFCSAGQPATTACTKDSDCNVNCQGLVHTNYITATIQGDEFIAGTCTSGFCSVGKPATTACTTNEDCNVDAVVPTVNTLITHVCLDAAAKSQ